MLPIALSYIDIHYLGGLEVLGIYFLQINNEWITVDILGDSIFATTTWC